MQHEGSLSLSLSTYKCSLLARSLLFYCFPESNFNGLAEENTGESCKHIKSLYPNSQTEYYWINLSSPTRVLCFMESRKGKAYSVGTYNYINSLYIG